MYTKLYVKFWRSASRAPRLGLGPTSSQSTRQTPACDASACTTAAAPRTASAAASALRNSTYATAQCLP
jgi:hypothetical protein